MLNRRLLVMLVLSAILTFFLENVAGAISFNALRPINDIPNARSIASGDLDGDGKDDLVGVSQQNNAVYILLGNGDNSFQSPATYPTSSNPSFVTVADLNSDGYADLVIAYTDLHTAYTSNMVSVLLGNGNGTFASRTDYATGAGSSFIVVADFNADGKKDVITINYNSNSISVLLGNGNGTFQPKMDYGVGQGPVAAASGDFNRDGKLDIAVENQDGDTVSILLNSGAGGFLAKQDVNTGSRPTCIATADVNSDGKDDLIVVTSWGGMLSVFNGVGDGTFQIGAEYEYIRSVEAGGILLKDFNDDGNIDIAVAGLYGGDVSIFLGNGDAFFQQPREFAAGGNSNFMTHGDYNGDGKIDIAVTDIDEVLILLGNGNGTFQTNSRYYSGWDSSDAAVGDFNADGNLDIAVSNWSSRDFSIFLGHGDGTLQSNISTTVNNFPSLILSSDFNNDGKTDIIVGGGPGTQEYSSLGDGSFQYVGTLTAADLAIDLNRDGKVDLVGITTDGISVFLGDGYGSFLLIDSYSTGTCPQAVKNGDFNNDGIEDLVIANLGSANVSILLGTGDGFFQPKRDITINESPARIASGDFNGDGKLDIAVTYSNSNTLSILQGKGDGSFQTKVDNVDLHHLTSNFYPMSAGDFDGDGKADLAVGYQVNIIAIYSNNVDGLFQNSVEYVSGSTPASVVSGDFNKDGKEDIAVVNDIAGDVSVILNTMLLITHSTSSHGSISCTATMVDPGGSASCTITADAGYIVDDVSINGISVGSVDVYNFLNIRTDQVITATFRIAPDSVPNDFTFVDQTDVAVGTFVISNSVTVMGINAPAAVMISGGEYEVNDSGIWTGATGSVNNGCTVRVRQTSSTNYNTTTNTELTIGGVSATFSVTTLTNPSLSLLPRSLSFGNQILNALSTAQTVTVTNTGTVPLFIIGISKNGANAVQFSQTNTCPLGGPGLAVGASCTIKVKFKPATAGAKTASLLINVDLPAESKTVTLTGTGLGPNTTVSPASLSFSDTVINTSSAPQWVKVKNTGNAPLVITGITKGGTNGKQFFQANTCPIGGAGLAPGSSCLIKAWFKPTTVGTKSASLAINVEGPAISKTITLSGAAIP